MSEVRRRDHIITTTDEACKFLERYSGCSMTCLPRPEGVLFLDTRQSIFLELVVSWLMDPGVHIPLQVEHKTALDSKFVLHHSPSILRVHQAWPSLERSVRIR